MTEISVGSVDDFAALGQRWTELEGRAEGSFFQSWRWVGCLAAERFADPVLVEATEHGRVVALALFNRVGRRLWLHEAGSLALDCPYIEQNGVLTEAGRTGELTKACLRAVAGRYDLVLSGIGDVTLAAARAAAGRVWVRRLQGAPFVDLRAVRDAGGDYLAGRSANTRQQIRRSDRIYGPISLERAESVPRALAMLDSMAEMHQASWIARGKPGSFAPPFFARFHRALIEAALPCGEIALLQVTNRETIIGILYNFVHDGRMLAYQSGFAYGEPGGAAKPGVTCHHAAIGYALAQGLDTYDFLAGEDRYKRSLANAMATQTWAEAGRFWSLRLLAGSLLAKRPVIRRLGRFAGGSTD